MRDAPASGGRAARARRLAWVMTVAATVISTFALDAFATAAGILLVGTEALSRLEHSETLLVLAATYVAWGAGLRANVHANWLLLDATGMSTNAVSKAAHDLMRRRTTSARARRIASGAGYIGSELVKEVPYYAGAFGAAVLSDTISSREALVFLAGTNLGAAVYEYVIARLSRSVLRLDIPHDRRGFLGHRSATNRP